MTLHTGSHSRLYSVDYAELKIARSPMNLPLLFLILATLLCFSLLCLFRHFYDGTALISVAIGAAINANIFNAGNMPIEVGWLIMGIDSMLYTIFMFTVIYKAHDYDIPSAKSMSVATIVAILVSAMIEMLAKWSYYGYLDWAMGQAILRYVFSCVSTFVGIWVMLWVYSKFKAKNMNVYVNFALCVLIASLFNSLVYYGLVALMTQQIPEGFARMLVGSYVGKIGCVVLGDLIYFINSNFWKPRQLVINFTDNSVQVEKEAEPK